MPKRIDRTRQKTPKPNEQYVLALKAEMDGQMSPVREHWEDIRAVRNRKHDIYIPEQFRKTCSPVRTHWVGDILRRVTAHLTLNFPTVSVPPAGPGDSHQRNSTLREKWTNQLLQDLDAQSAPMRFYRTAMDHAAGYGQGVLKCLYVPTAWPDQPTAVSAYGKSIYELDKDQRTSLERQQEDYKKGRLPLWAGAVDPRTWWGLYSQRRLRECLEVSERTVAQVVGDYHVRFDAQNKRFSTSRLSQPYHATDQINTYLERVTWIEHWNDTYVTYMANGDIVDQWEHGYGKPPYFPFYGLSNAMAEPGQHMESVVEHILDLVKMYDHLLTMWRNWAQVGAFPMGKIVAKDPNAVPLDTVEGTAEQQKGPDISFVPGGFKQLPPGYDMDWIVAPPVGRDLVAVSDVIRSFIEETIPNVLRGIGGSDQAGYAINQLITAAKIVYDPITDNAALAFTEMVKFIWWLIENRIQEKVYVWGEAA